MIYASGQNTLSNLSIGSTSQVLTVSGGIPVWAAASGGGGGGYWTQSGTYIYYNSGNVGIGTTNPAYPLDVNGNMNISGGLRANGSSGVSGQVLTSSGGGAMSWSTVSGTGSSTWTTSGSDVYRSSGKVGIGTTTPAYTLDVDGDIRTTSENGFRGNGHNITGINITSERNQTIINFGQQSSLVQSVNGDPL